MVGFCCYIASQLIQIIQGKTIDRRFAGPAQIAPLKGAYCEHAGKRIVFDRYLSITEIPALRAKYARGG